MRIVRRADDFDWLMLIGAFWRGDLGEKWGGCLALSIAAAVAAGAKQRSSFPNRKIAGITGLVVGRRSETNGQRQN